MFALSASIVARGAMLLVLVTSLSPAACAPATAPRPTATAVSAPSAPLSPPVKVTAGLLASTTDSGIFIAQAHRYFQEEGIELDLQHFQIRAMRPAANGSSRRWSSVRH